MPATAAAPGGLDPQLQRLAEAQAAAVLSQDPAAIAAESRRLAAHLLRLSAEARLGEGATAQAEELFRQSLALHADPQAALSLGRLLLARGAAVEAAAAFERLVASAAAGSDEQAELHLAVGSAYAEAGLLAEAIREFQAALAGEAHRRRAYLSLGYSYWLLGARQTSREAEAALSAALAGDPGSYEANYYLAQLESFDGRYGQASLHLERAASARPRSPDPWLQLGLNAFAQGEWAAAEAALGRGVELAGGEAGESGDLLRRALTALARLALSRGDRGQAERLWTRVGRLAAGAAAASGPADPAGSAPTPGATAAAETLAAGEPAPALAAVRLRLAASLAAALNDWGTAEARRGNYREALARYREAERWNPDTPLLMRNLGLAAYQVADYEESARALARAVDADPEDRLARSLLAGALASGGRFAEAAAAFAEVGDALFADPRLAYLWAVSLARSGQPERAREVLSRLPEPSLPPPALVQVGALYVEIGDPEAALALLREAIRRAPETPAAHLTAGLALVHLGRHAEAVAELEAELAANPAGARARFEVALALLGFEGGRRRGVELARALAASHPGEARGHLVLGRRLLEVGEPERALESLELAARAAPGDGEVEEALAAARRRIESAAPP